MSGRIIPACVATVLTFCATAELAAGPGGALAPPNVVVPVLGAPAALPTHSAPQWATVILARPLFRRNRRPLPPALSAVVDETLPRLSAIIVTGIGRDAVFANPDGSAVAVPLGGRIGGYEVGGMTTDTVSLIGPDGIVTIHPEYTGLSGNGDAGGPP